MGQTIVLGLVRSILYRSAAAGADLWSEIRLPRLSQMNRYNRYMSAHVIGNPVPTPEEMGEILGLSSERVAAVRRIMCAPKQGKETSGRSGIAFMAVARKKSSRTRTSSRSSVKR